MFIIIITPGLPREEGVGRVAVRHEQEAGLAHRRNQNEGIL